MRVGTWVALLAGLGIGCSTQGTAVGTPDRPLRPLRILFFTKEALYQHSDAHQVGDAAMSEYLRGRGHAVTISQDPTVFENGALSNFDVALFFVTSGDFLSEAGRAGFQSFIEGGKGFVGVHTASATETDWPFYAALVGAVFSGHGAGAYQIVPARVIVAAPGDPLVSFLPNPWQRTDEWYFFVEDPATKPALVQLLRLDESSVLPNYPDAGITGVHPLSWKQDLPGGGRSFYTALGHTGASYTEEAFLRSIALGTEWAGIPASTRP